MVTPTERAGRRRLSLLGAATLFLVLILALRVAAPGAFTRVDGVVIGAGVVFVLVAVWLTWKRRKP